MTYSHKMTASLEDYLEVIGNLIEANTEPRVKDIAAALNISKPSVHTALHALEERHMIEHEHYGPIRLTALGKTEFEQIKRRHVMLFDFLHTILGVDSYQADRDACAMEHILSEESCSAIERYMRLASSNAIITHMPQK